MLIIWVYVVALVAGRACCGGGAYLAVGDTLLADTLIGNPTLYACCAYSWARTLITIGITSWATCTIYVIASSTGSAVSRRWTRDTSSGTCPTLVCVLIKEISCSTWGTSLLWWATITVHLQTRVAHKTKVGSQVKSITTGTLSTGDLIGTAGASWCTTWHSRLTHVAVVRGSTRSAPW